MHFDFANRRTTGGLPALELNGTDRLKKGSSWPDSSGIETMSTMPDETRAAINWSSQFIDKTRVCLARHPSFGEALRTRRRRRPRPRIRPRGVMECGSDATSPNCTRIAD